MSSDNSIVVIDNGSGVSKAGTAGEHLPSSVFPSIVGKVRVPAGHFSSSESCYVGEEALNKKGILNLKYPIEHGIITNWDDMETIWKHIFSNELRTPSSEHPVLLTEAPLNPKTNKEQMCSVMFESLNVPCVYIGIQAVLSLYSTAMTTGLVLDIGDGVTHIVPAFEGYTLPSAIQKLNLAGRDVTSHLKNLLLYQGVKLVSTSEFEICRDIKENVCYVACDYSAESRKTEHELMACYEMPDGNVVNISSARFQAPEVFFSPELRGLDILSVQSAVYASIMHSDMDVRRQQYENIILSGGSTMFPGFPLRLANEVKGISKTSAKINVLAKKERKFSVWIGGSVLGSLSSFRPLMMTRDEFFESGAAAIHRKCF